MSKEEVPRTPAELQTDFFRKIRGNPYLAAAFSKRAGIVTYPISNESCSVCGSSNIGNIRIQVHHGDDQPFGQEEIPTVVEKALLLCGSCGIAEEILEA